MGMPMTIPMRKEASPPPNSPSTGSAGKGTRHPVSFMFSPESSKIPFTAASERQERAGEKQ